MRIAKLDLLAYGHFRGLSLDFSQAGLHVVMGRNEAGKSTTLRAITGLLYGIDRFTQDAHVHKPTDLRIGGLLESARLKQRIRVIRRKGNTNTLTNEHGEPIDESVIDKLVGGISEETFKNAFGLDHNTLEGGAKALLEGRGDLGESLFDASVGGGGEVQRLLAELHAEADRIYRPRATQLPLNEALRELADAQKIVRERQSLPEAYLTQEKTLSTSIREREHHIARHKELKARKARLDRAKKRLPQERRKQRLLDQRKALGPLADQTGRIEKLKERFKAYERALDHQREAIAEAERLIARVAEAARRAGVDPTSKKTDALRLEARQDARLTNLLEARTMFSKQLEHIRAEIARAERELALELESVGLASKVAEGMAPVASGGERAREAVSIDSSRLRLALDRALALGDVEARIASERARAERKETELEARATALGIFDPRAWADADEPLLETFSKLRLPSVTSVERLEKRAEEIARQMNRLYERGLDLEKEIASIEKQRAALTGDFAPPDAAALRAVRVARDEAWKTLLLTPREQDALHRAAEVEVERLMRDVDAMADRMIREADRVTALARLRSEEETTNRQLQKNADEKARVLADRAALDAELERLFAEARIKPGGFAEMVQWLERHAQIVDAYTTVREAHAHIAEETSRAEIARVALALALDGMATARAAAPVPPAPPTPPPEPVTLRSEEVEEEETAPLTESPLLAYARSRGAAIPVHPTKPKARSKKRSAAAAAQVQMEIVATRTSPVPVSPRGPSPYATLRLSELIALASQRLSDIESSRGAAEEASRNISKLRAEIEDRSTSRAEAEAALADVTAKLGEILAPLGIPTDASAEEVNRSIEALRELFAAHDKRADNEARVRVAESDVKAFEEDLLRAVADLAPDLAEMAPRDAAVALFERGEVAKDNARELATVEAKLEEIGGDPAAEEAERAILTDPDPDFVARAESELDTEIEEIEAGISRLDQSIGRTQSGLDNLRAESNAADAATAAQIALARVRENVEHFARVKLASVLLHREIERYREENQGPLLASSSTLFSRLTLGAYVGIKSGFDDKDRPCLRCVRADGSTEVDVAGLSDGTRDQLYLSLRLATLLRRAEITEPMPLILDDVLIQLDDQRAAAALVLLSEVAQKMQVLFFTHHARLVDLAESAVPKDQLIVHDLNAAAATSADKRAGVTLY